MITLVDQADLIRSIRRAIPGTTAITLFGSRAKDSSAIASDLDIAVFSPGVIPSLDSTCLAPHLDLFWINGNRVYSFHRRAFLPETLRDIHTHGPMVCLWSHQRGQRAVEPKTFSYLHGKPYRKT